MDWIGDCPIFFLGRSIATPVSLRPCALFVTTKESWVPTCPARAQVVRTLWTAGHVKMGKIQASHSKAWTTARMDTSATPRRKSATTVPSARSMRISVSTWRTSRSARMRVSWFDLVNLFPDFPWCPCIASSCRVVARLLVVQLIIFQPLPQFRLFESWLHMPSGLPTWIVSAGWWRHWTCLHWMPFQLYTLCQRHDLQPERHYCDTMRQLFLHMMLTWILCCARNPWSTFYVHVFHCDRNSCHPVHPVRLFL